MERIDRTKGCVVGIRKATLYNTFFRREMWTGEHLQITVMAIPVGGEIGLEMHDHLDQFLVIEQGSGAVFMGDRAESADYVGDVREGSGVLIPAGTYHNLVNDGKLPLKLFSVYAPPNHPIGTLQRTKEDADRAEG